MGAGTALVTNAHTPLADRIARHLAAHGAPRLLLTAAPQEAESPAVTKLAGELSDGGVPTTVVAVEPGSGLDGLRAAIDGLPAEHPLSAVLHVAEATHEPVVDRFDLDPAERSLRDAALATALDAATRGLDLSVFLTLSTAAGVLGVPGGHSDGPAEAALEALSRHRRAAGLPSACVTLGPCTTDPSPGTIRDGDGHGAPGRAPLRAMPVSAVLTVVDRAPQLLDAATVVADVDWDLLLAQLGPAADGQLLRGVPEVARQVTAAAADPALLGLSAASVPEQQRTLLHLVRTHAAVVLGYPSPDELDADGSFLDLGLSSFTALELTNRLRTVGVPVAPSAIFDHPTPARLAEHLRGALIL
jgi:aryl carrier-like protein